MHTRTRVIGMAIAVTAVSALALSGGASGVPVEWRSQAPATATGPTSAATAAATPSPQAVTKPVISRKPPKGAVPAGTALDELKRVSTSMALSPQGTVTSVSGAKLAANGPDAFVHRYAAAFGLSDAHGLARVSSEALTGGDTVTRYAQTAGGLQVLGGEIVVTSHGASVRSALATTTVAATAGRATVTAAAAGPIALAAATDKLKLTGLHVAATRPWQYDPSLIGAPGDAALRPAWQVDLADAAGGDAASILVDALDSAVRLALSTREEATNRIVCDLNSLRVDLNVRANYACTASNALGQQASTRSEGEAASSVAEVNKVYDLMGAVHDFYSSKFGIDSFDGHGAQIRATVRACDLFYPGYQTCNPYPNAFWEGTQFVFGDGYAVDDVVAHEFTHAVTENSSHLIYAYQPGAINEAVSDIMGELFDQSYAGSGETEQPWLLGEDLPGGAIRSMSNPMAFGQPQTVGGAGWQFGSDDNGGVHTNSGPANYAAYQIANQIGNAKSQQLWWRVMHLLPSGTSYTVLGNALNIACVQLIGHFGVTSADCVNVRPLAQSLIGSGVGLQRERLCPTGQPAETLYYDGFEGTTAWQLSSPQWLNLPAANAPYQFATTGHGSLNGWIMPNGFGNGATATMPTSVVVPPVSGGKTYVFLSYAALTKSTGTRADLEINVNGAGWTPASLSEMNVSLSPLPARPDYTDARGGLSGLAGKKVQFRMRITGVRELDFYVDDFRIYQCVEKPTAPRAYAYLSDTTANVGVVSAYSPNGNDYITQGQTVDHYEYQFIPSIPGAPTSSTSPTISIPNVPVRDYKVSIRTVTNTGAASAWTQVPMSQNPIGGCQAPAYPVGWLAGLGPDRCHIVKAPR